ncbi:MAG: DUF167 domain-containing protein [Beutenbergiaceae bacterium]
MSRVVQVKVKPGSRGGPQVGTDSDGTLILAVREQAVDGKATEAARRLLAQHLQVRRSAVRLIGGATSRLKLFRIED